jgi:hypothetical protein
MAHLVSTGSSRSTGCHSLVASSRTAGSVSGCGVGIGLWNMNASLYFGESWDVRTGQSRRPGDRFSSVLFEPGQHEATRAHRDRVAVACSHLGGSRARAAWCWPATKPQRSCQCLVPGYVAGIPWHEDRRRSSYASRQAVDQSSKAWVSRVRAMAATGWRCDATDQLFYEDIASSLDTPSLTWVWYSEGSGGCWIVRPNPLATGGRCPDPPGDLAATDQHREIPAATGADPTA